MDTTRTQVTSISQAGRGRKGPAHMGRESLWRQIGYCAEHDEGLRNPPHLQKGITTSPPEKGLILPCAQFCSHLHQVVLVPNSMLDNLPAYFPMSFSLFLFFSF